MMAKISRRHFLRLFKRVLVATGLAAVLGPVVAYFYPPHLEETPAEPVPAGPLAGLSVGGSKMVRFGRYPALVIHTPAGLRAYSAVCTHFACLVKLDPASGEIICPCHDGRFDLLDGRVLGGPPPAPLAPLPVAVVEGQIFVGGAE